MKALKTVLVWISLAAILLLALCSSGCSRKKLEPYIEIELSKLSETYHLLDTFASDVWRGWDNYLDIPISFQFPNMVSIFVGPKEKMGEEWTIVRGLKIRGKDVYINRKNQLPLEVNPPLFGGGKGGKTIRIMLNESKADPKQMEDMKKMEIKSKGRNTYFTLCPSASEAMILLFAHEFFHAYQDKVWKSEELEKKYVPATVEFAAYSEIEGKALLGAYHEKSEDQALECLKDFIVARELKHSHMTPFEIKQELKECISEGTATYANVKLAQLVLDKGYQPEISKKADPFFNDYKEMDAYVFSNSEDEMKMFVGITLDRIGKWYKYGLYQCLVLDRFVPNWTDGFFEDNKNLDQMMGDFLNLSDQEKMGIEERFKTKYNFDELFAAHQAAIRKRDDAKAAVLNRKGKRYIVDFKDTKEILYLVIPRGGSAVTEMPETFLPNGIIKAAMGDVEMTSIDTPLHKSHVNKIEWVDTEAKPGEKGYELTFKEKTGDTLKGVVFKTKGFTLKAPEIRIQENEEKNEVLIRIMSKMAR